MSNMPKDPIGPMQEAFSQLHEIFLSFQDSGFTEQQALYLCGQMMRGSMNPGTD